MNNSVLVTGVSGLVGRHLYRMLRARDFTVCSADMIDGINLTDRNSLNSFPQCGFVVNLAAKTFVPDSFNDPFIFYANNILSTLTVLEYARKHKAKVIHLSSYVYGAPDYLPIDEHHKLKAYNPYAQSKIVCEEICKGYARDFDIDILIFRPFNIYGSGQSIDFLIPLIIQQAKTGIVSLKDHRPKRDYVYVADVVNAIMAGITKNLTGINIINLGSGSSNSIAEIIDFVKHAMEIDFEVKYSGEVRKNEVMDVVADISRAKKVLEWEPRYSLVDGILKIIKAS